MAEHHYEELWEAIDQKETDIICKSLEDHNFRLTWGYRRCSDFDAGDGYPGQDYLTFKTSPEGYAVGVLADGVSQSFMGNIAARVASDELLQFLYEWASTRRLDKDKSLCPDGLLSCLETISEKIRQEADNHQISSSANAIVRQALDAAKKKGSQTVFSAFVFFSEERQLHLLTVGDVIRWDLTEEKALRLANSEECGRLSSASFSESQLYLSCDRIDDSEGILLHSDGIQPSWIEHLDIRTLGSSAFREAFTSMAETRKDIDDVSMLALQLLTPKSSTSTSTPKSDPGQYEIRSQQEIDECPEDDDAPMGPGGDTRQKPEGDQHADAADDRPSRDRCDLLLAFSFGCLLGTAVMSLFFLYISMSLFRAILSVAF